MQRDTYHISVVIVPIVPWPEATESQKTVDVGTDEMLGYNKRSREIYYSQRVSDRSTSKHPTIFSPDMRHANTGLGSTVVHVSRVSQMRAVHTDF